MHTLYVKMYGTALMQCRTRSRLFVESQVHVKHTYFSTLMAHRSGNRSRNTKLHLSIQSWYRGDKYYPSQKFLCFKVPFLVLTQCSTKHTRGKQWS